MQSEKLSIVATEKKRRKSRGPAFLWVLLLCFFAFLMGYTFHDEKTGFADVIRYYDMIESFFSKDSSIEFVILYSLAYGNDFIYYLLLFLFAKTPLGMQFVTGLACASYYYLLINNYARCIGRLNFTSFILLLGLFALPNFVFIITISRMCLAIVFFFIGVIFSFKERRKLSFLFFVLAVMTHFASLMFVIGFVVTALLYKYFLKDKQKMIRALCIFLPPLMYLLGVTLFASILDTGVLSSFEETRYNDAVVADGAAGYDNYSWSHQLQFLFSLFFSYLLLNFDKSYSFKKVLLLFFLSMTALLFASDQNLFNRWLMALPLICSLVFSDLFVTNFKMRNGNNSKTLTMFIGSGISFMIFLFLLYGTRGFLF